jgi:hypothetical protein
MAKSSTRMDVEKDHMVDAERGRQQTMPRLWERIRQRYDQDISDIVSDVMSTGGVSIHDVLALEMAAMLGMQKLIDGGLLGDRAMESIVSTTLQSRKHMSRILLAMGEGVSLNDIDVTVPPNLFVLPPADTGDELQ